MNARWWILGLWLSAGTTALGFNTSARLVLAADTARPGDTVFAGVVLDMNPGWHTYWRNPGESGIATKIDWSLPEGVTAGPIQWPVPEYHNEEGLVTYVQHGTAVLLVPLELSATLQPGPLRIEAEVSWLECKVQCVPGDARVSATLTVGNETRPSADAELIATARSQLPHDGTELHARATWAESANENERGLKIEWADARQSDQAQFFPYTAEGLEILPQSKTFFVQDGQMTIRATVKRYKGEWPTEVGGVITVTKGTVTEAFAVTLPIAAVATSGATATPHFVTTASSAVPHGAAFYLLLALGGGLILNLMPCVLPILSLKVLSLVRQGASSQGERRVHGLVYTLGVLVSFWAIAGLVIVGRLSSWGAQFQDPRFLIAVTVLMTLVALNLFGVFEFILPGGTVTRATQLASREGAGGAFFNGVLAVVLGASCVAPMLAAAVGWAISQPPLLILLVFTMIGIGLALPFLLLSFFPALQHLLPKPGPWMEKFKVAMGFPMLATAAWLLSQTSDHFGAAGPLWVGLFLVLLALALWVYGEFVQRGTRHRPLAAALALLIAAGGYAWTMEGRLDWRTALGDANEVGTTGGLAHPKGLNWVPWSVEAVEQARARGQPVLVDFTANWCLTCNTIVKPALEKDAVIAKLESINAETLIADFTLKDSRILEGLKQFHRAGVPLVVFYPANPGSTPRVLPDPNPFLGASHYAGELLSTLNDTTP